MLKRAIYFIVNAFGSLSAIFIAVLAVLVAYSAFSRYVFTKAVAMAGDLTALLFLGISFTAVASTFVAGQHVRFSLVFQKFPRRAQAAANAVCALVALFGLSIFIKLAINFTYESYLLDCHSLTAQIYLVPWMSLMPIGILVLAMALLVFCIDNLRNIAGEHR